MEMFMEIEDGDPVDKYRNIQFLLHMDKLFGREAVLVFLNHFIYEAPELFISENLQQYRAKHRNPAAEFDMTESMIAENFQ